MMRKIPVFVSCPTDLSATQEKKRSIIINMLKDLQLEPRALGRSDYPKDYPLKEIFVIARHCSGGVILGFEQCFVESGVSKRGIASKERKVKNLPLPTPWNQLEAGILFGLKIPLLIFKEDGISGGIFDIGVTDLYVHPMPPENPDQDKLDEIKQVFLTWQRGVMGKYYDM